MDNSKDWPMCLGDTVDEIRLSLIAQGVKGVPKKANKCIIARSYKAHHPNGWSGLRAGYSEYIGYDEKVNITGSLTFDDCQIMDPRCPRVLAEFMLRFDRGEFPELIMGAIPDKNTVLSSLSPEAQLALGY